MIHEGAGWTGVYEILLIVLVVVWIMNGLIRQKIMRKVHDDMERKDVSPKVKKDNNDKNYTSFEVIE